MSALAEEIDILALRDMSFEELAEDPDAVALVARLTRDSDTQTKSLKVAAFQSYIDVD